MRFFLKNKYFSLWTLLYYFAASGIAAVVNLLSRVVYNSFLSFGWAVVYAYFTGMIVNFVLSSRFVFTNYVSGAVVKVLPKFLVVATGGLLVTWVVSESCRLFFQQFDLFKPGYDELAAHATGIGVAFFASFAGHQLFTYRHTGMLNAVKGMFACK